MALANAPHTVVQSQGSVDPLSISPQMEMAANTTTQGQAMNP